MSRAYTVPRDWAGETVICIGTGPSLTLADVEACRGRARVIAVNNAYTMAPWADVLYAADRKFWGWKKGAPEFPGLKLTIEETPYGYPIPFLRNVGIFGLAAEPDALCTGFHSGYQAINLAVHFGAARILLLGYDLHGTHYFGDHPDRSVPPFAACLTAYPSLVAPLAARGITLLNCTPGSAINSFPRAALTDALALEVAA